MSLKKTLYYFSTAFTILNKIKRPWNKKTIYKYISGKIEKNIFIKTNINLNFLLNILCNLECVSVYVWIY